MIILRNRTLRILLLMVEMSSLQLSLSRNMDPYKTLGVSRHASKSEIRKIYHAHCLFYHPDKHTQRPAKEREKYEKGFKQVQEAYNTIRSVESKEQHTCKDFDRRPTIPGMSLKSIYVQKVKIPLGKLYEGCSFQFEVRDNLWMRYRAAIRGRFIFFSIYQGIVYALPIFRTSKYLSAVVGVGVSTATLPRLNKTSYDATIRKGSRGGNYRFTSAAQGLSEVIFQVESAPHPIYRIENDDLYTELTITSEEARDGCKKTIKAIDSTLIEIVIPANKYKYEKQRLIRKKNLYSFFSFLSSSSSSSSSSSLSNKKHKDSTRIPNRGWPKFLYPDVYLYGDLIVNIKVTKH